MNRKRFFEFWPRLDPPQIRSKCQNKPKSEKKIRFPNMGCGYSTLVSLDALNNKKRIFKIRYTQVEKTSKNLSAQPCFQMSQNRAVFGRFLKVSISNLKNYFCIVQGIKRHKSRVPTTYIGKIYFFPLFGLFWHFDQICGGGKRGQNRKILFLFIFHWYRAPIPSSNKFLDKKSLFHTPLPWNRLRFVKIYLDPP